MEGAGSRMSRASSRYGPTTTVFSGPVRRWKKKWVHVPPSTTSFNSRNGRSNNNNNNDNASRLLLRRWTPISTTTTSASADPDSGEPPRRKFRYTPVAVLEEQKNKKVVNTKNEDEEETSDADQSTLLTDKIFGKSDTDELKKKEAEDLANSPSGMEISSVSNLNLDLGLQGHSGDIDLMNKMKEAQVKTASSGGFWLN